MGSDDEYDMRTAARWVKITSRLSSSCLSSSLLKVPPTIKEEVINKILLGKKLDEKRLTGHKAS